MSPDARGALPLFLLSLIVAAYLRSRSVPSLRPAARACLAFVALDAARLAIDVGGRGGWRGHADVGLFVAMSGPWAALVIKSGAGHTFGHRSYLRPLFLIAALLSYSAFLLIFRHLLAHHWNAALQAPRLATGAAAMLIALQVRRHPPVPQGVRPELPPRPPDGVAQDGRGLGDVAGGVDEHAGNEVGGDDAEQAHGGMRGKDEGPGGEAPSPHAPPVVPCGSRPETVSAAPLASGSRESTVPQRPSTKEARHYNSALSPSTAIGIALSLSAAASVVGGLWWDWEQVRILSAVGWIVAGVLGWWMTRGR